MTETVHTSIRDGVATLRIENSEKRNALSPSILQTMDEAVQSLEQETDIRTLVVTGTGEKAFSSGYDISSFEERDQAESDGGSFDDAIERIQAFPYPTIAMINGHVFGGAVELIAVCDMRIAVEEARFGVTPAKLGLIYGDRGINQVMNLVGPAVTKELLFTGEPIDADRALRVGLLNHAVDRSSLEERTYEMADQMAANAPKSLRGMKRVVQMLLEKRTLSAAERELVNRMRADARASDDHHEGVAAFADNREPEFTGE